MTKLPQDLESSKYFCVYKLCKNSLPNKDIVKYEIQGMSGHISAYGVKINSCMC